MGLATAGLFTAPFVLESCMSGQMAKSYPAYPGMVPDFSKYSAMFDASIAELRLYGAGPIIPAEAEASSFGMDDVAEQILTGAEAGAELSEGFELYGAEMVTAAQGIYLASEQFPKIEDNIAELAPTAENDAFLKVSKASAILNMAAEQTAPMPERVPVTAQMYAESEIMVNAIQGESPSTMAWGGASVGNNEHLAEGSEHLWGYSEVYVGASQMVSATQEFAFSSQEFSNSLTISKSVLALPEIPSLAEVLAQAEVPTLAEMTALATFPALNLISKVHLSADELLASASNAALSAELHVQGLLVYNNGETIVGGETSNGAEFWTKPAMKFVETSEQYAKLAWGEAAEQGAERMEAGSEVLAENGGTELVEGSESVLWGAEQYIGGTTNVLGGAQYVKHVGEFIVGAEAFARTSNPEFLAQIEASTPLMYQGAEDYDLGAEVLSEIETPWGAINVLPAANIALVGAEKLASIANPGAAAEGAAEMILGAEFMVMGAETAQQDGSNLTLGTGEVVKGSSEFNLGASEFAQAE